MVHRELWIGHNFVTRMSLSSAPRLSGWSFQQHIYAPLCGTTHSPRQALGCGFPHRYVTKRQRPSASRFRKPHPLLWGEKKLPGFVKISHNDCYVGWDAYQEVLKYTAIFSYHPFSLGDINQHGMLPFYRTQSRVPIRFQVGWCRIPFLCLSLAFFSSVYRFSKSSECMDIGIVDDSTWHRTWVRSTFCANESFFNNGYSC